MNQLAELSRMKWECDEFIVARTIQFRLPPLRSLPNLRTLKYLAQRPGATAGPLQQQRLARVARRASYRRLSPASSTYDSFDRLNCSPVASNLAQPFYASSNPVDQSRVTEWSRYRRRMLVGLEVSPANTKVSIAVETRVQESAPFVAVP